MTIRGNVLGDQTCEVLGHKPQIRYFWVFTYELDLQNLEGSSVGSRCLQVSTSYGVYLLRVLMRTEVELSA